MGRDDSSSSDEDQTSNKVPRPTVTNPTDFLVDKKPETEKKAVWEKSIGTLSSKKGGLGILVKKKVDSVPKPKVGLVKSVEKSVTSTSSALCTPSAVAVTSTSTPAATNALGMLG